MIEVADGGYCVDRYEVTRAEYEKFEVDIQDASFFIDASLEAQLCDASGVSEPLTSGTIHDHPVRSVNWCDAYLYCKAVGKRLCGKVGGGPNASSDPDSMSDEWFRACSDGQAGPGTMGAPGLDLDDCSDCDPDAGCNENAAPSGCSDDDCGNGADLLDVGSYPRCVTDAGVHDMIGSVWEWEDSCDDGGFDDAGMQLVRNPSKDLCWRRGGAWTFPNHTNTKNERSEACLSCNACDAGSVVGAVSRGAAEADTGIRCCADVKSK